MNSTLKKTLIISAAALAAAAVAVAAVLFILKAGSRAADARLDNPPSSSSSAVQAVSSEPPAPVDNGIRLVISSPEKSVISVTAPEFTFSGTSDREEPLTVNGTAIERTEDGSFTYSANLNVGKNVFTFEHKGETKTYTVNYRYVIIESYSPSKAQTYPSGATLVVNVKARRGSSVTAAFNGKTITLTAADNSNDEKSDFISFNGVFELPKDNAQDINLGKIVFKATHAGKSESFSSGAITCKKSDVIVDYDPKATPTGGRYMNVGSGYIAEIVGETAETFDGNVSAASLKNGSVDWSRPTNNYLPCGTVDYSSPNPVIYESGSVKNEYVTLRAGYRVYKQTRDKPNTGYKQITKQYIGTLPDHNEIRLASFENGDTHTVLTFDTNWKAPFYFDLWQQNYANPATQNYNVSAITFQYVYITFCYATEFDGDITIPEGNPLFDGAKIVKNMNSDSDYTLQLHLKKTGAFYGWDCAYNDAGQLVFTFLNPRKIAAADNEYGFNLNGAKILIDVGHGGRDGGAAGLGSFANSYCEKIANLNLAEKIKAELEKTGAKVIMTRTGDTTSSTFDKISMLKREKPDYCIAVHHNSSVNGGAKGFGAYYSNAFSKKPSEFVLAQTKATPLYSDFIFNWHYYFMCRITTCPVVLTENGFMSNSSDFSIIRNDAKNTEKAKAITRGIVDHFRSIQ